MGRASRAKQDVAAAWSSLDRTPPMGVQSIVSNNDTTAAWSVHTTESMNGWNTRAQLADRLYRFITGVNNAMDEEVAMWVDGEITGNGTLLTRAAEGGELMAQYAMRVLEDPIDFTKWKRRLFNPDSPALPQALLWIALDHAMEFIESEL